MEQLNERLRRQADELRRRPIPLADLIPVLQQAADAVDQQQQELTELRGENDVMRASLANGGGPCLYCKLPVEEWGECRYGFPGCPRGDDAMLCPHVGAGMEVEELRQRIGEAENRIETDDKAIHWLDDMLHKMRGLLNAASVQVRRTQLALSLGLQGIPTTDVYDNPEGELHQLNELLANIDTAINEIPERRQRDPAPIQEDRPPGGDAELSDGWSGLL